MTEEEKSILRDEIVLGNKAKQAWDSYFQQYFDEKSLELVEAFKNASLDNPNELMLIKYKQHALEEILEKIDSDILTGKMAQKSLEDAQND